jgi:folate-binding Fe-S cluster repair protein YgfZ
MTQPSHADPAGAIAPSSQRATLPLPVDLAPLRVLAVSGPMPRLFSTDSCRSRSSGSRAGACRYACFNSPKGRMLANFVVWREPAAERALLILLPGDLAQSVAKRLSMYVLRSKVSIADVSDEVARIGIGGPGRRRRSAVPSGPCPRHSSC